MLLMEIYVKFISNFSFKNQDIYNNPESFLHNKQAKSSKHTKPNTQISTEAGIL